MAITIREPYKQYTRDFALLTQAIFGDEVPSWVDQVLTRYDFQNKIFRDIDDLNLELQNEFLSGEVGDGLGPKILISMDIRRAIRETNSTRITAMADDSQTYVILFRGCNQTDACLMRQTMSAGGLAPVVDCGKPDEAHALRQVIGELRGAQHRLPEFTPHRSNIMVDRIRVPEGVIMGTVTICVQRKYLLRGDAGIMDGWVLKHEAPIGSWEWEPKR